MSARAPGNNGSITPVFVTSQTTARSRSGALLGGGLGAHVPQKQQQSRVVHGGNMGTERRIVPVHGAADEIVQQRRGLTCSRRLVALVRGRKLALGGPERQPAEECAGGGRELGSGSDRDPDQGGGAQLCQELFTLTEHAAAHLFTSLPSDSTPRTLARS